MPTTRTIALLLLALALPACTPTFDPANEVKGFRLVAIQASPPEITAVEDTDPAHAHAATLRTLLATPDWLGADGASHRSLVLHLTCTPRPGDPTATVCSTLSSLSDPAALLAAALQDPAQACAQPGVGVEDGIVFSGVESCGLAHANSGGGCDAVTVPGTSVTLPTPRYALPDTLTFSTLPQGDPTRITGAEAVDVALALDVGPDGLGTAPATASCPEALASFAQLFQAAWPQHPGVMALKRVIIRGPESPNPPNQNPVVAGVKLHDGTAVTPAPAATPTPVTAGQHVMLLPDTTGDVVERYVRVDSAGQPIETKDEDRAYSWFSTAGEFKYDHTTTATEEADYKPGQGPALVWTVVRDLRGGEDWTVTEVAAP